MQKHKAFWVTDYEYFIKEISPSNYAVNQRIGLTNSIKLNEIKDTTNNWRESSI